MRAQAREQMRGAILETARAHLAEHGAVGLSLRAVARDVGMVSSAVYRYFPSRDALLTALIIDAYDSLGAAVEKAERRVPRDDLLGRWRAIATTTRRWARADPHQYALVYGSPVPGYAAPQDTVGSGHPGDPAARRPARRRRRADGRRPVAAVPALDRRGRPGRRRTPTAGCRPTSWSGASWRGRTCSGR